MAPEKYQNLPQAPPLFTVTSESILADMKKLIKATKGVLDRLVADVSPYKANFGNALAPMLMDDNLASSPQRIMTFYQYVSPHDELREAGRKAEEEFDDFRIESHMHEDVFRLVNAALASRNDQHLESEPAHVLEKEHKSYARMAF